MAGRRPSPPHFFPRAGMRGWHFRIRRPDTRHVQNRHATTARQRHGMSDDAVTRWIESLEGGDEDAAARLWEYCFPRMLRYASRRLPENLRRAMDEEDVAISAFRSFCMATARGAFTELNGRDELWRLLLCITARKARARIRHETRKKRGGGKVAGESILIKGQFIKGSDDGGGGEMAQVAGNSPSPEMLAQFTDDCQRLLDLLGDDTLKAIALLRVEGYTVDEIAQRVGCAKRSVERRLTLIRKIWSHDSQQLDSSD